LRIFKFYTVALNTMALFNLKVDTTLFDSLLANFTEDSFREIPLIDIYYHIILSFLEPENDHHFFEVKRLVIENDNLIDSDTKIDIYINLENYCHRKFRSGDRNFLKEGLEIYNLELERELHLDRGFMSSQFYTSAAVTACRLGEFDWVRNFLEKYKKDLPKDLRDSTYYYGLAFMEYELENYEKALEHLAKVKGEDLYLKMDIRILQSRIYYSLVWNMPLQSLLDTFRKTVQNNKHMKEDRKEHYLKFIKYLHQMNNGRYKEDISGLMELRAELQKEDYFPHKIWLDEELAKLSG
jgi:tetratricopeptide (TPR) repeat protein